MFKPATGDDSDSIHSMRLFSVALLVAVIAGVIAITQAQRKVPVQYAQRAVGRKVYQGGTSFMPLRVNYAGVMPVIFASAILMFPAQNLRAGWADTLSMPFLTKLAVMLRRTFLPLSRRCTA